MEELLDQRVRKFFEERYGRIEERGNVVMLLERIVRVEEEIKSLKESQNLMLEMMNKRFDDLYKIINLWIKITGFGLGMLGLLMRIYKFF